MLVRHSTIVKTYVANCPPSRQYNIIPFEFPLSKSRVLLRGNELAREKFESVSSHIPRIEEEAVAG
jgi:hypothetical protein